MGETWKLRITSDVDRGDDGGGGGDGNGGGDGGDAIPIVDPVGYTYFRDVWLPSLSMNIYAVHVHTGIVLCTWMC